MKKLLFARKDKNKIDFEKSLRKFFVLIFILLIAIQLGMINDSIRGFLTPESDMGRSLTVDETLFNEGKLRLQLVSLMPDKQIKILINGEEVKSFETNILEISVKNGDILGVDCKNSNQEGEIEIVSKTPNIQNNCVGKRFRTNGDPKGTLRINVTNKYK